MADTPTRSGPTNVGVSTTTITTAGAANTYVILRTIQVVNETANTVTFSLGIGTTNADAVGKRLVNSLPLGGNQTFEWTGFIPLLGGASPDLLYAICNTAAGITVTAGTITGP